MAGLELLLQIIYDNSNARGESEWASVSEIHQQAKEIFDGKEIREYLEVLERLGWVRKQKEVTSSYRVAEFGERILEEWRRYRLGVRRC